MIANIAETSSSYATVKNGSIMRLYQHSKQFVAFQLEHSSAKVFVVFVVCEVMRRSSRRCVHQNDDLRSRNLS